MTKPPAKFTLTHIDHDKKIVYFDSHGQEFNHRTWSPPVEIPTPPECVPSKLTMRAGFLGLYGRLWFRSDLPYPGDGLYVMITGVMSEAVSPGDNVKVIHPLTAKDIHEIKSMIAYWERINKS